MRKLLLILSILGFVWAVAPVAGQDGSEKQTKKAKKEIPAVTKALKKTKLFNGRPNAKAKYYIYLQSAGWCGFCRKEMPDIVKGYKEMKKNGVEIIFCSFDKTQDAAKEFIREFGIRFPAMMETDDRKGPALPGYERGPGIPWAVIVDAQGHVLRTGQGAIVNQWSKIVSEAEKKAAQVTEEE